MPRISKKKKNNYVKSIGPGPFNPLRHLHTFLDTDPKDCREARRWLELEAMTGRRVSVFRRPNEIIPESVPVIGEFKELSV